MESKNRRKQLSIISNFRNKNEKASWMRKKRNLESLVKDLEPIEEELRDIMQRKNVIMDKINEIRDDMIVECIHPLDYLIHNGDHVICRFCESKLRLVENE